MTSRTASARRAGLAHRCYGFVGQGLDGVGRQIGEAGAGLGQGLVEHAPLHGVLDEPGQVAFFHAALSEEAAHGDVGVARHRHGPAGGGVVGHGRRLRMVST